MRLIKTIVMGWICLLSASLCAYEYEVSMCAIFYNEASILREWIEFHRIVGVEHFYLYNNNSTDEYMKVLAPYVEKGIVEVIDWPMTYRSKKGAGKEGWWKVQVFAYMDCIDRVVGETKWLAILDCDEFLFPVKEDQLTDILPNYEEYGGLAVNWLMYGTSDIYELDPCLPMISQLLYHLPEKNSFNTFVKCIVRPECVHTDRKGWCSSKISTHFSPHRPLFHSPYFAVNEKFQRVNTNKSNNVTVEKIRINHYWTRNERYLNEVKLNRPNKHKVDYTSYNKEYDTKILKYEERLVEALSYE